MTAKFVIIGRLTGDPKLFTYDSADGKKRGVSLSIAVNRGEETTFFNCAAFGKTAEIIFKYVKKGDTVGTTGDIGQKSYINKEGVEVTVHTFTVREVSLMGGSKTDEHSKVKSPNKAKTKVSPKAKPKDEECESDEDYPF